MHTALQVKTLKKIFSPLYIWLRYSTHTDWLDLKW